MKHSWLLVAVGCVGCSGAARSDSHPAAAAPRAAPLAGAVAGRSQPLLDQLDRARFDGPLQGLDGELDAAGVTRSCDREEFDTAPNAPWFDGAWRDELLAGESPERRATGESAHEEGLRFLRLEPRDEGLHRFFAAPAAASLVVRARLRAPPGAGGAALFVLPHGCAAPEGADLAVALRARSEEAIDAAQAVLMEPRLGGEWVDVSLTLAPRPGRRSVSVSLIPSEEGLDCDFIELREVAFPAAVAAASRPTFDAGRDPRRRTLELAQSTVDALLLPNGTDATFAVALPPEPADLVYACGALAALSGPELRFEITLDGVPIALDTVRAAPLRAGQPLRLHRADLAGGAGRTAQLKISTRGAPDAVGFVVSPRIVARERAVPAADAVPAFNLVVLSIDTLRADALGCYGTAAANTPQLDALAARGARFERVWSPSSYTLPTHASLFSGQHPYVHGLLDLGDRLDPQRTLMLAQRLRAEGYATAAFTGGGFVAPSYGFGAGFDLYSVDDPMGRTQLRRDRPRPAPSLRAVDQPPLEPALDWLDHHAGAPFFLFLHTFFVHNYTPAPAWLQRFDDPSQVVAGDDPIALRAALLRGDAAALRRLRALYAATVAQVDAELVGAVLRKLAALHLLDRTLVCVVADHGEEFGEHGQTGHGHALYVESTRVPWLLAGPNVEPGLRMEDVELADVAPTLAARLSLTGDPRVLARDVFAPASDDPSPPLLVLGKPDAPTRQAALHLGAWKLMSRQFDGGEPQLALFELDRDFAEKEDLSGVQPARRTGLARRLAAEIAALREAAQRLPSQESRSGGALSEEERAALRELGYLDD